VILDMIMPEMDGNETFRRLKQIDPTIKVLISSGFGHIFTERESAPGIDIPIRERN
jgi:CheY-like chemotaxis protein